MKDRRIPLPSQQELKDMFEFEAEAGVLRWKDNPNWTGQDRGRLKGKIAGSKTSKGNVVIKIDQQAYAASRVIWKLLHDEEPHEVRHKTPKIDHNGPKNLRGCFRIGKSLPVGVCQHPKGRGYCATIHIEGRRKHIGTFPNVEAAATAYNRARSAKI